jgi:3-oxoacyl-[acyl-carrier protein] reductase
MNRLQGRVALVTGSSRGIGRAIAVGLAEAGADIVGNFVHRAADAADAEREILALGRRCVTIQADVSRAQDVERLVRTGEERAGPIDILINNAGIARPQPIEEISEQDWDDVMDNNLKSCFLVTKTVVPGMRARQWGRIVSISSVAAQVGGIIGPHYAASKAGMLGMTRFYANRLAKEGITVNAIAPALVETEMVTSNPAARPDRIPIGRFGTVEEVADVAVMLACNAYITGQTISVNGGWYLT